MRFYITCSHAVLDSGAAFIVLLVSGWRIEQPRKHLFVACSHPLRDRVHEIPRQGKRFHRGVIVGQPTETHASNDRVLEYFLTRGNVCGCRRTRKNFKRQRWSTGVTPLWWLDFTRVSIRLTFRHRMTINVLSLRCEINYIHSKCFRARESYFTGRKY